MNKHAYVTVIRLLGKLAVRAGLDKLPGYGGGWEDAEKSYFQQALEEFKFYHGDADAYRAERGWDTAAGAKPKSTRAA